MGLDRNSKSEDYRAYQTNIQALLGKVLEAFNDEIHTNKQIINEHVHDELSNAHKLESLEEECRNYINGKPLDDRFDELFDEYCTALINKARAIQQQAVNKETQADALIGESDHSIEHYGYLGEEEREMEGFETDSEESIEDVNSDSENKEE